MSLFSVQSGPNYFSNIFSQIQIQDLLPKINFQDFIDKIQMAGTAAGTAIWNFRDHAISELNTWDHRLDQLMPNFPIQTRIDQLLQEVEQTFAPLASFNDWLNSNGHGEWYHQLAECLAKLPFRAARNIVQQLYVVIKGIVYGVVHPLKALNSIAKLLVLLPYELVKPETWSTIGMGIVGSSCGEAAIMGGIGSVIGVGIGGALVVAGISIGTLRVIVESPEGEHLERVGKYVVQQGQKLSEVFLTSFYTGLIIGAIRKAIQQRQIEEETKRQRSDNERGYDKSEVMKEGGPQGQPAADLYEMVDLCRSRPDGYPPVAYAVKLNRPDVVKFLLDNGESISSRTPHIENWVAMNDSTTRLHNVGNTEGFTALELAVREQNPEMVKLLTTYNSAAADPLLVRTTINIDFSSYSSKGVASYSTPLSDAITTGNQEVVAILLKACKEPEKFFATFEQIRAIQCVDLMRVWIEHYAFLHNGTCAAVSEETVKALLNGSLQI